MRQENGKGRYRWLESVCIHVVPHCLSHGALELQCIVFPSTLDRQQCPAHCMFYWFVFPVGSMCAGGLLSVWNNAAGLFPLFISCFEKM